MSSLAEAAEKQDAIIRIQSEIINDLFLLLLEHISAEEADKLPVVNKINIAARLKEENNHPIYQNYRLRSCHVGSDSKNLNKQ